MSTADVSPLDVFNVSCLFS